MYSTYQLREYLQAYIVTNLSTLSFLSNCSLRKHLKVTILTNESSLSFQVKFSRNNLFWVKFSRNNLFWSLKSALWVCLGVCVCVNAPKFTIYKLTPTVTFLCLDLLFKSHKNSFCYLITASIMTSSLENPKTCFRLQRA